MSSFTASCRKDNAPATARFVLGRSPDQARQPRVGTPALRGLHRTRRLSGLANPVLCDAQGVNAE
jgi:hypothetical protein